MNKIVLPGQEIDVTVNMTAPTAPGNYISFFRFVYGDNNRFGQKVWCDILVTPAPAESLNVASEEKHYEKSSLEVSSIIKEEAEKEAEPLELQFVNVPKE